METTYELVVDNIRSKVRIYNDPKEFVTIYNLEYPKIEPATEALLDSVRERLITDLEILPSETLDPEKIAELKEKFLAKTRSLIELHLPHTEKEKMDMLAGVLLHQSLGLGQIEMLLNDQSLEEVVINNSKEPVWVYHRKLGWLKTNVMLHSDTEIYNYAATIGRRIGSQITYLNPLMDAYLATGDRANATLFPISSKGNTLTIRKFASRPWTITDFIEANTLSTEIAAFLWLAIQYEMNVLISGGTASGKTSLLNVISGFIPPTNRIISIEDTREIQIPNFLHWVPLTTRPPNAEGNGEVTMLELLVNSLRMRPDRVLVGEIRRGKEAEVLFEAIHTGHAVYATLHANTDDETVRRLVNPPINIPPTMLNSLHLVAVMHRDRRKELRRLIQVSEIVARKEGDGVDLNNLYSWNSSSDTFDKKNKSVRIVSDLEFYTGMAEREMQGELKKREDVLRWLVKKQIKDVNKVGEIFSMYSTNPENVMKMVAGKA